jgi:hypothetical protein
VQDPNAPFGQPPTTPPALPPSGFQPPGNGSPGIGDPAEDFLGWVGLVLGAVGWLSCCCSIIPFVGMIGNILGMLIAVAAVVLGGVSVYNAKREGRSIVIGVIAISLGATRLGLFLGLIILVLVLLALGVGGSFLAGLQQQMH